MQELEYKGKAGWWIECGSEEERALMLYFQQKTAHPVTSRVSREKYPPLFEEFWKAYHPERRVGKIASLKAWKKLSEEDQHILPNAAGAYSDYIMIQSSPKYMKHPQRFIDSGFYQDWAEKSRMQDMIDCIKYWDTMMRSHTGYAPAWTEEDKTLASNDINSIGSQVWKEKVWIFFSGNDPAIEQKKEKLGIYYKVFHGMLANELTKTRIKEIKPCKYCGEIGKHTRDCPITVEKMRKKEKEKEEFEKAKEMDFDFKGVFRK